MTAGAAAGTTDVAGAAPEQGGTNPFYEVTNLFAQKNKQGAVQSQLLGAAGVDGGGQINPGNFLRMLRLIVATTVAGVAGTLTADGMNAFFKQMGLLNVDGAEILYNTISGYEYVQAQRFFRPWLKAPEQRSNWIANANNPSGTFLLMPEVRQQLGVLENTDTRSQYQWTHTINLAAAIATGYTTNPTVSITPYADMWAQPDAEDLEKVANQQIPPGVNLQTKLRHQVFTMNPAGSDNNLLSTLTGNAVRGQLLIARDQTNARADALTDPIQWQLDQRNLGVLSPEMLFEWAEDFYEDYGGVSRPTGVYPFPRFYNPGCLYGQGWLYTANSTAESWESSTGAGPTGGTITLLQEEVYATGPVDPTLIDL